ncbi:hypothetical protein HO173_010301 [Letharia columbiana]|uniref:DUF4604 domain-containing protein n=1 Tax=Letharia columbiana TaxID=112416 RepID=A0A8H6FN30_9LECA|nr:uncharacterized protein HO173_010301 [Letharia columbiana]KAF6231549.1 hypothetical protein HO173_010301 [Letharia columbiana]
MSFNAKNLSYASNEPAFLRKLRGDYGDRDSSRHERPLARPRKQVQEGEDNDQPTYVVEDSQDTLSKAEYEALVAADTADKDENNVLLSAKAGHVIEEAEPRKDEVAGEAAPVKQAVAGIGGSTKRRLAKVVGDEGEDKAASEDCVSGRNSKTSRVKKGKKMKLSFDDEGTEP